MSEPRQYRRDPATGGFCEDRLAASPLPLKVCPNPKCAGGGYYVGEQCSACHECSPTGVPCGVCEIHSGGSSDDVVIVTDDDDESDDTDIAPTQPDLPEVSDPPGGSD